ncbi:NAD(P)/FAD-dependent oxidoreductase [Nocardioides sp. SYSU DS0663]|uniref:NAD(P)/FAD-dependent oxidoreductase n=1 Tax=Nocardioides sp. SYSU DS0663 TaxID=3416445 RepID=UPI003F4BA680
MSADWDLVVVGAGPAGTSAALGALHHDPSLRVLLLDRADFPRDKACGDGIAPHALDMLAGIGVRGLLDDRVPVRRLRLSHGPAAVERAMARPAYVVPRTVLDARLVEAALAAGATLRRHRVREVRAGGQDDPVAVDDVRGAVVVGADGAHSQVRRALGRPRGPAALAVRGYAPVADGRRGAQVIRLGTEHQPSYAWSFDCGDGTANVGYGELLRADRPSPTRADLLARLDRLLPGATAGARAWQGHHLPLSTARWRPSDGRVLLAGDAAGLVNPLTGEGIFYAVATGLAAGRAAATAVRDGRPQIAGRRHRRATREVLLPHLRHTAAAARLSRSSRVLTAGLHAAGRDQRVFDDLVELGLARGRLTPTLALGLGRALLHPSLTEESA